mmetsp:Transcript_16578/g.33047  ORF Transcript_16578/g.33047 Transcript_16578/m.33047 type:complete len:556 (-) Transcript_16578:197-1864(-)|eukprot:CAMPEP_0182460318 /NCGR_PEP_ID=MMETSP1319-20130603/5216_1 /TAXON_ID=172717 /ORGANISM="Bolidomonas pacifica, Strain RCC208" /LENGTH=555 /DNA_ID=CAMNT_0024659395 /DNA_START=18 /DNA_END=1685 /DNA_ORIENTATION=-
MSKDMKFVNRGNEATPMELEAGEAGKVAVEEAPYTCNDFITGIKSTTREELMWGAFRSFLLVFFLYFFLFFLDLMGGSFKVLGGCQAGAMFDGLSNPIAGLMVGIIATVLVQSSSTSTSIVVSLVGASAMSVPVAIPVIMGANIGTSVTNTIVSFGQVNDLDQFERAFSGATVHDMFNMLSVLTLLPIELIFHPLEAMTDAMKPKDVDDGEKWVGPIKKWVAPLVKRVLNANKSVIKEVAQGGNCADIYAEVAAGTGKGLIKCGDVYNPFDGTETYVCPAFYKKYATKADDMASGSVALFISIIGLCICLYGLVRTLQSMVKATSTGLLKRATHINPYLAIVIGVGVTLLVQSSSITTSVLTPLVGMDVINLEQMLPLTLGANIGTTATALLASLVSDKPESVQIALCHFFFNIFGILIWFPVPFMREIPLRGARTLGWLTRKNRAFPAVYIIMMFVIFPLILLGTSTLFESGGAYVVIGTLLVIVYVVALARVVFFFVKQDGWTVFAQKLDDWQKASDFKKECMDKVLALEERVSLIEAGGAGTVVTKDAKGKL